MKSALIVVDMQRDFMPGGALSVPDADLILSKINKLMEQFPLVIATKDHHPKDHISFASSHAGKKIGETIDVQGIKQVLWPEHCVEGSPGSEFDPRLHSESIHETIHKGTHKEIDSYSTFFDNAHKRSTGLAEHLKNEGITDLFLCGVATDYCVLFSALDAVELGFSVHVIEDVCKGVDLKEGDCEKAFAQMLQKGIKLTSFAEVKAFLQERSK